MRAFISCLGGALRCFGLFDFLGPVTPLQSLQIGPRLLQPCLHLFALRNQFVTLESHQRRSSLDGLPLFDGNLRDPSAHLRAYLDFARLYHS